MKKMSGLWLRYLPLALALSAPAWMSANAQEHPGAPGRITARQSEIAAAARIYGYSLDAGNWTYDQTRCVSMPDVALFHYRRRFPDGAESRFTAVVPREGGRVRIVPVLYHNATPYLPAAENPRNYALFNELVPQAIASRDAKGNGKWRELSACYADLTGALTSPQSHGGNAVGIAEAPSGTISFEPNGKTSRVTIATRENGHAYKLWTISFNRHGRVTAVETEDHAVYAAAGAPPVRRVITKRAKRRRPVQATQARTESPQPVTAEGDHPPRVAVEPAPEPEQRAESSAAQAQRSPSPSLGEATPTSVEATSPSVEAGWKFIPQAPPPPVKIVSPPPTPALATTPE